MKTFKLISLDILEDIDEELVVYQLPLLDGLIIDREDEKNQWVLECLLDLMYSDYFSKLKKKNDKVMLQAKITKESNEPATFMSSIININEMSEHMNVLFIGHLINLQKGLIHKTLKSLLDQGYQGDALLDEFKDRL